MDKCAKGRDFGDRSCRVLGGGQLKGVWKRPVILRPDFGCRNNVGTD